MVYFAHQFWNPCRILCLIWCTVFTFPFVVFPEFTGTKPPISSMVWRRTQWWQCPWSYEGMIGKKIQVFICGLSWNNTSGVYLWSVVEQHYTYLARWEVMIDHWLRQSSVTLYSSSDPTRLWLGRISGKILSQLNQGKGNGCEGDYWM